MLPELHARSAFSFLLGSSTPESLVRRAAEIGLSAIAITDHLGFYGSARAHHTAQTLGIQAIVGTSLLLNQAPYPVLCASPLGYQTLSRHLTNHHLQSHTHLPTPLNHGHLFALTGDRHGPVVQQLLRDQPQAALAATRQLIDLFGHSNVGIEIFRHNLPDDARLNRSLIDLASFLKLPLIISNAPLYAHRHDRPLADAFTCLRHHTTLDQAHLLLAPNSERHLKSPQQLLQSFSDLPNAIHDTIALGEKLPFTLANLGYRFPDFPGPDGQPLTLDQQTSLLRELTLAGAHRHHPSPSQACLTQIDHEINLIHHLGFSGYFLIVHDIVRFARSQKILCQGRGSAANSTVCFCLGITCVDTVKQNLVFERFLSEKQKSWPDIDIDFPSGQPRESVIQYVLHKYGPRGAAMTANVITYQPRSAFREMSKVLGFPPSTADRFSTLGSSPHSHEPSPSSPHERLAAFEDLVSAIIPPSHPRLHPLAHLYHAALQLPRHLSQHPGGIVICDRGLDLVTPIQPATMPHRTIVQWDKDDCEDLGIVKIDLLGLGMLAAIQEMLTTTAQQGHPIDPSALDLNDPKVFQLLHQADTIGTFQVESRAQMATLAILKPSTFYELAIQIAIVRPGPIVGDLLHPYLRRRNGLEKPDCIHPSFEPVLSRTLGVPLFQEQVLRMAMLIADFSGAEADELRRAMSFHRSDERMQRVTAKLRERMSHHQVPTETQEKVIHAIGNFALYGFPESHALSFAAIAYLSCYLKAHHPAPFYAALINHQPMGFYSTHSLIQDAKRHHLHILPVSVTHSLATTHNPDPSTLRLGLHQLKGLSSSTITRILLARQQQPFANLHDFLCRSHPNLKEKRLLARSGALNDLPATPHRRHALWQVELPLHHDLLPPPNLHTSSPLPPMTLAERLSADIETQGTSPGPHPMKIWHRQHPLPHLSRASDLHHLPPGFPVHTAGLVICRQRPGTAKGHCFISLEDETGIANLFVPRTTFLTYRTIIVSEPFLLAHGKLQLSEGNQPSIYVTSIEPLPHASPDHATPSHNFH